MDEVVSAFPSKAKKWSVQTTRTWDFVGLRDEGGEGKHKHKRETVFDEAKYGQDIIVGLLDSGTKIIRIENCVYFKLCSWFLCDLCLFCLYFCDQFLSYE